MLEQVPDGDGVRRRLVRDVEPWQVCPDWGVKVNLAVLQELENRHRGHHLGDRSDRLGSVWLHGCVRVRLPVACRVNDAAVVEQRKADSRDPVPVHLLRNEAVYSHGIYGSAWCCGRAGGAAGSDQHGH